MRFPIRSALCVLLAVLFSAGCGGGGGDGGQKGAAGAGTGNTAADGFAWINYRRVAAGLPELTYSSEIAKAAQNHSDYQRINGPFGEGGSSSPITHSEASGSPGYTGTDACPDRILAAGFTLDERQGYSCGEVISAMSSSSGFMAAEELIAAIYHRFIIFQPSFREAGAGSAKSSDGRYTIFTQNFAVRGSFAGLGSGNIAVYPFDGQTQVPSGFDHYTESPDPLPPSSFPQYANVAVGYPVSVHADVDQIVDVTSFTLRRRSDGALLAGRLLSAASDAETQPFSAAIVPFQQLSSNTAYVAEFSGTICSRDWNTGRCASSPLPLSRTWSFTTR